MASGARLEALYGMTVSQFTADKGWGKAQNIEASGEGGLVEIHAQIAIGANGDAFSIWDHQKLAESSVWVSRLD